MALGAFVAGMLISETEYKHQVEEDIKPFRDVLLGLFFITVGMLLNVRIVLENWWLVLILLAGPVLLKFALIAGLAKLFGAGTGTAMRTGLALAQAGEFGFVLLNVVGGNASGLPTGGQAVADLRGLGGDKTLVLLNGRRIANHAKEYLHCLNAIHVLP